MPIVMTGVNGGPMGGNGGAFFGSGLTKYTQKPKTPFSPNLTAWAWRQDEDVALNQEHTDGYKEIMTGKLTDQANKDKARRQKRAADEAAYQAKMQELREANAAEKAAAKEARKIAMAKPTLGDPELGTWKNREHLEAKSVLNEDKVAEWIWPMEKKHPYVYFKGLGAEHEDAMTTLPHNADISVVNSFVDTITSNTFDLTRRAVETRLHKDAELAAKEEKEKKEREDEETTRRNFLVKKENDAQALARAEARRVKKEMAEDTKKANAAAAEAAKKRYEKSQAERKEMVARLAAAENDDLRSETEIANERREGTSMNEGSRNQFRQAMRTGTDAQKEEFM